MVATLKTMTATKQRRVLTLLNAKLAAHQTHLSSGAVTHPLHEWMIPNDDPQRLPPPAPTTPEEQRVATTPTEQRVNTPSSIRRITNARA